jgi:hypothetical protein
MNRLGAISLGIVLVLLGLTPCSFAQSPTQPAIASVLTSSDCQIAMQVKQQATGSIQLVPGDRSGDIGQHLHLTLTNLQAVAVVGTEITMHGFSAKGHVTPALSGQTSSSNLTKTINLLLHINPNGKASTDVKLPGFTSVSVIDVVTVAYANGKIWHSSPTRTCHVSPDSTTLISSH